MRIVFHGGFHKTGTTSLQAALQAHAGALAGQFHVETRELSPLFVKAAEAARVLSARRDEPSAAALVQALADWVAGLPDGPGLLASSEDFAGHMPSRFGVRDYGAVAQVMPLVVAALGARFADAQIELLFTTRAAEPWLRSIHWQLSKHPQIKLSRARFAKVYAGAADFAAVLAPLRGLAGAGLHVVALESLMGRRLGPVEAMYDLAGLSEGLRTALEPLPKANQSPEVDLAEQFVELNRSGLPPDELRQIKRDMRSFFERLEAEE